MHDNAMNKLLCDTLSCICMCLCISLCHTPALPVMYRPPLSPASAPQQRSASCSDRLPFVLLLNHFSVASRPLLGFLIRTFRVSNPLVVTTNSASLRVRVLMFLKHIMEGYVMVHVCSCSNRQEGGICLLMLQSFFSGTCMHMCIYTSCARTSVVLHQPLLLDFLQVCAQEHEAVRHCPELVFITAFRMHHLSTGSTTRFQLHYNCRNFSGKIHPAFWVEQSQKE